MGTVQHFRHGQECSLGSLVHPKDLSLASKEVSMGQSLPGMCCKEAFRSQNVNITGLCNVNIA